MKMGPIAEYLDAVYLRQIVRLFAVFTKIVLKVISIQGIQSINFDIVSI